MVSTEVSQPENHQPEAHAHGPADASVPALRAGHALVSDDDRLIAALCYASQVVAPLLVPVIVLLLESHRRRPFVRYHAIQSLAFTLALAGAFLAFSMGFMVVQAIPIVGVVAGLVAICLIPVVGMGVFVAYLLYGVEAFRGAWFSVPLLTDVLREQGWLPPAEVSGA